MRQSGQLLRFRTAPEIRKKWKDVMCSPPARLYFRRSSKLRGAARHCDGCSCLVDRLQLCRLTGNVVILWEKAYRCPPPFLFRVGTPSDFQHSRNWMEEAFSTNSTVNRLTKCG
ncbi:unnamed protein product [Nippostrongylus brasiliensis]|uniref:THAP-type domain-containing protein n=1 Tax=Nippostrongylus brasiliensis TaxID=27835 RepID=A0A0N4XER2_NIPBR|nr:unnamed protein product [Nippostrongylus brasiliensis]